MKNKSQKEDLIKKYIKNGLNDEKEVDNMQSVNIPDDIMDRMNNRCKEIHCLPRRSHRAMSKAYKGAYVGNRRRI